MSGNRLALIVGTGVISGLMAGCVTVTDSSGREMSGAAWLENMKNPGRTQTPQASQAGAQPTTQQVGVAAPPRATASALEVPTGTPGTSNAEWPASQGCRVIPDFIVATDVDTAYARLMRKFKFSTPEDLQISQTQRGGWIHESYRHVRQSGSYYQLAQPIHLPPVDGAGQPRKIIVEYKLSKDGPGTLAGIAYCPLSAAQTWAASAQGHKAMQDSLVAALQR